jgi:hypothetical protein
MTDAIREERAVDTGKWRITGLCHAMALMIVGAGLALLLGADGGRGPGVPPGLDAAAQRIRMEEELISLNAKMDELILLLRSGNVKVTCLPADTDGRGPKHGWTPDADMAPSRNAAPTSIHAR